MKGFPTGITDPTIVNRHCRWTVVVTAQKLPLHFSICIQSKLVLLLLPISMFLYLNLATLALFQ